jgi:hypothetical protein
MAPSTSKYSRKRIVFSNFESCKILLLTENVEILNNLSLLEVWQKMHRFQSTGFTVLLLEYLDVDGLENKKQRGIQTLKERASQRQKIRDVRYYEAIDRLEKLHTSDEVFCHRKCYSLRHLLWYFPYAAIKSLTPAKRKRIVFSNFESYKILLLTENVEILNNLLHTSDEVFCHRKCYSGFTQKQSKPLKPEMKGKRQMLNRQSRNMELHVRIRWLRRRPNTRVEDL